MILFTDIPDVNHKPCFFFRLFLTCYLNRINMKKILTALSLFVLCIPSISLAHPGHGNTDGYTITHYFTEPVHVVIAIGVLAAVAVYTRQVRKSKQANKNN
jgi:hydrogenase/urease accessory protein HupE